MKKSFATILALGLMTASSAFAGERCWLNCPMPNASSTWETIRADKRLTVQQSAGAETFGFNGFFDACVDGDQFRSLTARKVCVASHWVRTGGGGGQEGPGGEEVQVCDQYANQFATLPIHSTEQVCEKYHYSHTGGGGQEGPGDQTIATCVRYGTVEINLSTTPLFSVATHMHTGGGQESGGGEDVYNVIFKKSFAIPACK